VTFVFSSSASSAKTFFCELITLKSISYEFKSVPAVAAVPVRTALYGGTFTEPLE